MTQRSAFGRFLLISVFLHLIWVIGFLPSFQKNLDNLPLAGGGVEVVGLQTASPSYSTGKNRGTPREAQRSSIAAGVGTGTGSGIGPGSGPSGNNPTLATIRENIERAKRYPAEARRQRQEGVVSVQFQIDASGNAQSVTLLESSSHILLDEEALATIKRGAPYPTYDKPIRLAIRFSTAP
ncbi:MAG: energy transducer TonB [Deltaproteobacteria bacterium]|nr:energy transducer TonB [Deltaproteobacteria bacterium]